MTNKFKVGDRVKLVSTRYGDSLKNPQWGGCYGEITGTIWDVKDYRGDDKYDIMWDNKEHNTSYRDKDLEFAIEVKPKIKYSGGF